MQQEKASRVCHLCILALAIEWIFFGSLHFTFRQGTLAEVPPCIPFKILVVGVTGMVEVATGILILFPKMRKFAAATSLVLLVLFLPSIYRMLVVDDAMKLGAWTNFVRVLLVPNHVFLILCAVYLWRSPESLTLGPAQVLEEVLNYRREPAGRAGTFVVASVMLLANVAGLLVILSSPWHQSPAMLWAIMCLATGALAGFLFGVPRVNPDETRRTGLRPNTNIEVVSDWLTKIIVGVGLVEFHQVGGFLKEVARELGQALSPQIGAESFAQALIVYFFVAGAIQGYLLTRMYLTEQFEDDQLTRGQAVRK
ncbi:MAG TPA: hypothetical protein VMD78_03265 [Candidatus Baltobacteraceae bacterium]|nr:hypothetical protein [Candidatus Baltobacteraceae bacterium]